MLMAWMQIPNRMIPKPAAAVLTPILHILEVISVYHVDDSSMHPLLLSDKLQK